MTTDIEPSTPEALGRSENGQRDTSPGWLSHSWRLVGIFILFVVLFAFLAITSHQFLHTANLINILDQQSATLDIAAAGTLVLVAGGVDLSVGATYGLTSVLVGEMAAHHSPIVAIAVALGTGLGIGLVNGLVITFFKINALIATLATSFIISAVALKVMRGNLVTLSAHSSFFRFANARFLTVPSAVWISIVFVVILALLLGKTTFGRYVIAVGGNAEAARLAGVRVNLIRVMTFVLSGGAAALGGTIDTSRLLSAQAGSGGSALTFTVLVGIVVGGTSMAGGEGSVVRTVMGVLFVALIATEISLRGIDPLFQPIVLGVILLGALALDVWVRRRRHEHLSF